MKKISRRELSGKSRSKFSERLILALRNSGYVAGPTTLSRLFNAHYNGPPVTIHACRKWIVGEAIPTHDKLEVIARMLGVAVEWLAFGDRSKYPEKGHENGLCPEDARIIADIKSMEEPQRSIAREIVALLAKLKR